MFSARFSLFSTKASHEDKLVYIPILANVTALDQNLHQYPRKGPQNCCFGKRLDYLTYSKYK